MEISKETMMKNNMQKKKEPKKERRKGSHRLHFHPMRRRDFYCGTRS